MSNQATVFYPNNTLQLPINIKDSIDVTYRTPWQLTNLTLLCRAPTSSLFDFYNVPDNPLAPTGHYQTSDIESMNLNVHSFPADCKFRLTQYRNNGVNADSAFFVLNSVEAPPRTFAISSTIGLSTTTGTSTTTSTATSTPPPSTTTAATNSQTPSATTPSSTNPSPPSSGLSRSASIGIGVGISTGVIVLLVAAFILFTNHRRKKAHGKQGPGNKESYDKAELAGFIPGERSDHVYGVEKQMHYLNWFGKSASPVAVEKQALTLLVEADGSDLHAPLNRLGHPSTYGSRQASRERHELQG